LAPYENFNLLLKESKTPSTQELSSSVRVAIIDDANVYATIDDVTEVDGEQVDDDDQKTNAADLGDLYKKDDEVFVNDRDLREGENVSLSIEKNLHADNEEGDVDNAEDEDEDVIKSFDDALGQLDDATLTEDYSDEEKHETDSKIGSEKEAEITKDEIDNQEDTATKLHLKTASKHEEVVDPSSEEAPSVKVETAPSNESSGSIDESTDISDEKLTLTNEMISPNADETATVLDEKVAPVEAPNVKETATVSDEKVAPVEVDFSTKEISPSLNETEHRDIKPATVHEKIVKPDEEVKENNNKITSEIDLKSKEIARPEVIHPVPDLTKVSYSIYYFIYRVSMSLSG